MLEDNAVLNVQEAVKFVSGVQTGTGVFYDNFLIRGFSNGGFTYRNGLKIGSVTGTEDTSFVDRVEIVKGPAAMLYGRIQPGGLVNFVTKRPQDVAGYSIQEQFGSWGLSRTTVDFTGPVNSDKSILYRVIGVYDRADDFIAFRNREHGAFSGEVSWRPTNQFEANVGLEYYNDSWVNRGNAGQMIPAQAFAYRVPWLTGRPANLPRSWTQGDPTQSDQWRSPMEREAVSADWTYRFDDKWKITNRFLFNHSDETQRSVVQASYNFPTGVMTRFDQATRFYRDSWSLNLDLSGEIDTGPIKHKMLYGFDYYWNHTITSGDTGRQPASMLPLLNIWYPIYGGVSFDYTRAQEYIASSNKFRSKAIDFGYYVQDDISYNEFIHFLIGGRYDVAYDATSDIFSSANGSKCYPICPGSYKPASQGNPTERKISPNGGLLFKLTPEYSIYASYSESFASSNAAASSIDGTPFKPQEGQQYEVGAKASLFGGKVTASVAAFDLYMSNVLTANPINILYSVATGKVRSRGVELDAAGQITDNISVIASYTYDDAIIVKDNTTGTGATLGKRWPGVPRNAGNLWAKYDTAPGQKEGWSFGAGFYANGLREGNNTNSFALPGYVRFDTMIGWRTVLQGIPVEAQLNVTNLADAKYFESVVGNGAYYGAPRTFTGSIKMKF